jgi:hypothetical protein
VGTEMPISASESRRSMPLWRDRIQGGSCEPLYACAERDPQSYSLRTGTLKQRNDLGAPQRQIWTRCLRPGLACLDIQSFDGQP